MLGTAFNLRMSHSAERRGILAGGNFIIDYVKIIDRYPEQDTLASIVRESRANGGGPYNLLKDLAALGAGFPLEAAGRVGDDANGRWVLDDCAAAGIGTAQLRVLPGAPTSYTDAMTVESTGRRTFFHQRGANARLEAGDFDFAGTSARFFYLGYMMLLDTLDSFDDGGRTRFSRALEAARAAGLRTCADLVSTEHADFAAIANSSLPFVDVLVLNEIEAEWITGIPLRRDIRRAAEAARALIEAGVGEFAAIHFEGGAVAVDAAGAEHAHGSVRLPRGRIAGATGAGDAFAAGLLLGAHEGEPLGRCLEFGVCAAAASLADPTPSGGVLPLADCLALGVEFGYRDPFAPADA